MLYAHCYLAYFVDFVQKSMWQKIKLVVVLLSWLKVSKILLLLIFQFLLSFSFSDTKILESHLTGNTKPEELPTPHTLAWRVFLVNQPLIPYPKVRMGCRAGKRKPCPSITVPQVTMCSPESQPHPAWFLPQHDLRDTEFSNENWNESTPVFLTPVDDSAPADLSSAGQAYTMWTLDSVSLSL